MHRDTLAMVQQLEAQVPQWISVKERLPSLDGDHIVRCKECANQRKYGDMTVCLITSKVVLPNFYCNFGTKK